MRKRIIYLSDQEECDCRICGRTVIGEHMYDTPTGLICEECYEDIYG